MSATDGSEDMLKKVAAMTHATETPITDRNVTGPDDKWVDAEIARDLERRLAAAEAELQVAQRKLEKYRLRTDESALQSAWGEAREAAAKLIEPKGPRPCDCYSCDCGNSSDFYDLVGWESSASDAARIRAMPFPETRNTDERDLLRAEQARLVMPHIGPLLDAWEVLPNDVSQDDDLSGVRHHIEQIFQCMDSNGNPSTPAVQLRADVDDEAIRAIWRANGGDFHGPHIETGKMPESKLLPFLRRLIAEIPSAAPASPAAAKEE